MARTTKPELVAPTDMSEDGRDRLALFLSTVWGYPDVTQTLLRQSSGASELIERARGEAPDGERSSDYDHITYTVGRLLETEIDLEVEPDAETVTAMRHDISEANKIGELGDRRRTVRLATFAGEVATWRTLHENSEAQSPHYMEVVNGGGGGAAGVAEEVQSMGVAAFAPPLPLNAFGDSLPEIA